MFATTRGAGLYRVCTERARAVRFDRRDARPPGGFGPGLRRLVSASQTHSGSDPGDCSNCSLTIGRVPEGERVKSFVKKRQRRSSQRHAVYDGRSSRRFRRIQKHLRRCTCLLYGPCPNRLREYPLVRCRLRPGAYRRRLAEDAGADPCRNHRIREQHDEQPRNKHSCVWKHVEGVRRLPDTFGSREGGRR